MIQRKLILAEPQGPFDKLSTNGSRSVLLDTLLAPQPPQHIRQQRPTVRIAIVTAVSSASDLSNRLRR